MTRAGGPLHKPPRPSPSLADVLNAMQRLALMRRVPGCRGALSVDHICTLSWVLGEKTVERYALGERVENCTLEPPLAGDELARLTSLEAFIRERHAEAVRNFADPALRALLDELLAIADGTRP